MRPTFSHMTDTEAEDAPAPVVRAPTPDRTLDGLRRRKKKTNRSDLCKHGHAVVRPFSLASSWNMYR
jgi:hypothetical protein